MKNWVIQSNIVSDDQAASMAVAARAVYDIVYSAELIPFSDEIKFFDEPPSLDLIPYGSTKMIQLALNRGWTGVFVNDNFNVSVWNSHHTKMLNQSTYFTTAGYLDTFLEGLAGDKRMFIRPYYDLKPFAGGIATIADIRNWRTSSVFGNFQVPDDTQVVLSPEQEIIAEQRWFIVGGKIVEGREYRRGGKLCSSPVSDLLQRDAQRLADEWLPHENCVMDTAITRLTFSVVEFNCLNCSGMYGHDPLKIVRAIHALKD